MTTDVEYVVMCIFVILCICLGGVSVQTFCHLKTFKKIELWDFFINSNYKFFIYDLRIFKIIDLHADVRNNTERSSVPFI